MYRLYGKLYSCSPQGCLLSHVSWPASMTTIEYTAVSEPAQQASQHETASHFVLCKVKGTLQHGATGH